MDNTEHIIQELKSEKWEMAQEIERLRAKYEKMLGASVAFQIAIQNALFVFEKAVDDIHQKESE